MADRSGGYSSVIGNALDMAQGTIYLLAALFLVMLAVLTLLSVVQEMSTFINPSEGVTRMDVVDSSLEHILVIFIITGLIQTLVVYYKSHTIDISLVLSVGLTAVIRRVLVFGARPKPWEDVAVTAMLLVVIIAGLYLLGRNRPVPEKQGSQELTEKR